MRIFKNRKIIYSFEYGGYSTRKERLILHIAFGVIILFGIALSLGFGLQSDYNFRVGAVCGSVAFMIACGIIPLLVVMSIPFKEHKHDKIISEWLEADEIIFLSVKPWEYQIKQSIACLKYRFGVKYEIDGKDYCKISKKFDTFYNRIKNNHIDILYIPKYDQVLVLGDN